MFAVDRRSRRKYTQLEAEKYCETSNETRMVWTVWCNVVLYSGTYPKRTPNKPKPGLKGTLIKPSASVYIVDMYNMDVVSIVPSQIIPDM